jgi:hypothetical protein
MMQEPWLITRIWDYIVAVGFAWWGVVALLFFLMRLAPIVLPSCGRAAVAWLERAFFGLAILCFVVANFKVFDQEQRQLRALTASPAFNWSALPTSPADVQPGAPWNDGGVVAIKPLK